MSSFDPIKLFYATAGAIQDFVHKNRLSKWLRRLARSRRVSRSRASNRPGFISKLRKNFKNFFFVRWIVSLFFKVSAISRYLDARIGKASKKSGTVRSLSNWTQLIYQTLFVEPARGLVVLIGVSFRWVRTRRWFRIALAIIPSVLLFGVMLTVWYVGRLDRDLALWYQKLGEKEIELWEANLGKVSGLEAAMKNTGIADAQLLEEGPENSKISAYAELLFKRLQLLAPNQDSQVVIAHSLMQRGAISSGQEILKRLAPDDGQKYPKAHAVMAVSYLVQFIKSRDSSLLSVFEHHAQAALKWGGTPKDVLVMAGDLNWQRGNQQKALEMYQRAAAVAPEMNVTLFHKALAAGEPRLAELARERGVAHLQLVLKHDPSSVDSIAQLATLIATTEEGAKQAEELITKARALRPSPKLTRALSEVYRMRFWSSMRANPNSGAGFIYLDKAMVIDPSNPLVAEFIEMMVRQATKHGDGLSTMLSDMLVSGRATTGTHAMLAEYHMLKKSDLQAMIHLEQVFQVAPSAVKYANHLATLYAAHGKLDRALATASQARDLLKKTERLAEKYADDLLETIGKIHHQQKQYAEATEAYLQCLAIAPNRVGTRRLLAAVYRKSGDETRARNQELLAEKIDEKIAEYTAFQQTSNTTVKAEESQKPPTDGELPPTDGQSQLDNETVQ